MTLNFFYSFSTVKTSFKNLPEAINSLEGSARRSGQERYYNPMVELDTVRKVGFRRYLVIWKVTGAMKP